MSSSDEKNIKNIKVDEVNCIDANFKNKIDKKMHYLDNNIENIFDKKLKDEKYIYDKNTDIRIYEDQISKKKKRAFTLGAIDGIGDISILKAPLINPENPKIEPPILQLPSATNLIKNIHLKINFDKNIDKSYKYRTQNSNKDIINNMKPLYSLPEKVMTYYMSTNIEQRENWNTKKNIENYLSSKNESNMEKTDKNKGKIKDKVKVKGKDSDEVKENEKKKNQSENTKLINTFSDKKKRESLENENASYHKETLLSNITRNSNNNNSSVPRKEKPIKFSKSKLIQKNEDKEQFNNSNNFNRNKDPSESTNLCEDNFNIDNNFNKNNSFKLFDNKNSDELKVFEVNQIMSSTLTDALKKLADDVFV